METLVQHLLLQQQQRLGVALAARAGRLEGRQVSRADAAAAAGQLRLQQLQQLLQTALQAWVLRVCLTSVCWQALVDLGV
jgi:hypothetical protein